MANEEQLKILRQGVEAWNKWRENNPETEIDLGWADLRETKLGCAKLHQADLREANLFQAYLGEANLSGSNLSGASLYCVHLGGANLNGANLSRSNLYGANLRLADLSNANLRGAELIFADLVKTNLERADLTGCRIYGISVWEARLIDTIQKDLIISGIGEPVLTIDNLEVAQFIHLLLNNEKIRHVIDTMTSKVVLILGRFTPERKAVLDAIKEELRKRDYLPVLFDFEGPKSRDLTETISTLAHMARFVIADITDAKSIPAELQIIVPHLPSVPVQPLILDSDYEYGLFEHFRAFNSVLKPYRYSSQAELLASIEDRVIAPAEAKVNEIRSKIKSQE
jgi:hypothetical protein